MEKFRKLIEQHEPHGGPDYNRGFRDCKASILASLDHQADEMVELDDVMSWADGVRSDLRTEYADKVTPKEAFIAGAIWASHNKFEGK